MTNSIRDKYACALRIGGVPATMMCLSGLNIMCRAFFARDMATFIFGAFVYASAFALVYMLGFLELSKSEEPITKLEELTRFAVWFLATVVMCGYAIRVVVYMPAAHVDVLTYCLVITSSLLQFYVVHNIRDYLKKI